MDQSFQRGNPSDKPLREFTKSLKEGHWHRLNIRPETTAQAYISLRNEA